MIFIAKFIGNVLSILNSEESPNQLAAGLAYGAWLGLIPIKGLLPPALVFLSFLININLAMVAVGTAVFKVIAYAIDPASNVVGYFLLTKVPALHGFWTRLYNLPIVPYTRFNNTIVLGSFVIGLIALVPLFFVGKSLVKQYRLKVRDKVLQFKIMKIFKATSIYKYYETYKQIRSK